MCETLGVWYGLETEDSKDIPCNGKRVPARVPEPIDHQDSRACTFSSTSILSRCLLVFDDAYVYPNDVDKIFPHFGPI